MRPYRTGRHAVVIGVLSLSVAAASAQTPPGYELIQIETPGYDDFPAINDQGQVLFSSNPELNCFELYIYENGEVERLTWNSWSDNASSINSNSLMAFYRREVGGGPGEIYLLQDNVEQRITNSGYSDLHAMLNSRGDIVLGTMAR